MSYEINDQREYNFKDPAPFWHPATSSRPPDIVETVSTTSYNGHMSTDVKMVLGVRFSKLASLTNKI